MILPTFLFRFEAALLLLAFAELEVAVATD
jgi:hypothetical protein